MLPFTLLMACNTEPANDTVKKEETPKVEEQKSTFHLDMKDNDELTYENLRLYPVKATEGFINENIAPSEMKSLKEGINTKGFYVTEKKPYGRFEDSGAVNSLTIQNKSEETIYLMQGDIVSGGNQDRVMAQNIVVPPRTITDVNVYCVEKGRWTYRNEDIKEEDPEAKKKRKMFAFSGYYNVASSGLRKTMRETHSQQSVWDKVGELTLKNNASTSTGTYTGLEESDEFTNLRDAYMKFFDGKDEHFENCVGIVAVSGSKVLGVDIFGHPELFKRQFEGLLNGYITDAISEGSAIKMTEKGMDSYMKTLNRKFDRAQQSSEESDELFKYKGQVVHYSSF